MTPLSPSHKSVLRVRFIVAALILLLPAAILDTAFLSDAAIPYGLLTAAAFLIGAFLVIVLPTRNYGAWGYEAMEDELHVQSGILFRTRTVVPYGRVQHIDVGQGPVQRRYGVGTLTLHTAGTRGSEVWLPGLAIEDAERMRDEIRARIRQDLA